MKTTSNFSEKIQKTIDDFVISYKFYSIEDNKTSETLDLRKIAAEINVLPVVFDWTASWGIKPNG